MVNVGIQLKMHQKAFSGRAPPEPAGCRPTDPVSNAVQARLLYIRSPDGATRRINLGFYYPIYAAIVIINVALILLSYIKQIYTILWSLSTFSYDLVFMSFGK